MTRQIQAAILSLALLVPGGSLLAKTHHHTRRVHSTTYAASRPHHYSQTRGAIVGGVLGAVIDHRHPVTGGLIGAAVGDGVQYERNREARKH